MSLSGSAITETLLCNLIHDLRQPLGTIENSTYYLGLLSQSVDERVRDQVRVIERQVEQAERLLAAAAMELARARGQREEAAVSL